MQTTKSIKNSYKKMREMTEVKPVKGWAVLKNNKIEWVVTRKSYLKKNQDVIPVLITPIKVDKKVKKK